jgi:spermidine/putrescine transport system permease protein
VSRVLGRRFYSWFAVPGDALLLALFIAPLVVLVGISFGTTALDGSPQFGTTTENYHQALQSYFIPVFVRTLWYATLTTVICLVLGYPLAYFSTRFAGRFAKVIMLAIILTWLVDYLVRIYAWTALMNDNGWINAVLADLGLGPITMIPTTGAVIVGLVYGYFPLMVLPLYASLSELDPDLIAAGKDLYGSPRQTFWHVTVPATLPGIFGGVALCFLPALGDFATAQFLGGPNQTMLGNLISTEVAGGGSITFGAALTVVLLVMLLMALAVGAIAARLTRRRGGRRVGSQLAGATG